MGQDQNKVFKFKEDNPDLNKRKELSNIILKNNPQKVPIIIEPDLIIFKEIKKTKYLVPKEFTFAQLCYLIRVQLDLDSYESLFLVINGTTCLTGEILIQDIYNKYKDLDGFLYIKYTGELVWGNYKDK
jgi:GABA(A) receptor-associated protein